MRFVTPDVVRIPLKNGKDWIEVRKELSVGAEKRFRSAGFKNMTPAGSGGEAKIDIDWQALAFARVDAWLVDWSASTMDLAGKVKPVELSRAAIESLSQEDFDEIDDLIQKHIAEQDAGKKQTVGEPQPEPITS